MACVFPGVSLTRATAFRFKTALMRLDLPTFERPTIANCGLRSVGKSSALYAARWNSTVRMSTCVYSGKCKSRGAAKRYLRVVWEINDGDCAGILRRRSRDGHDEHGRKNGTSVPFCRAAVAGGPAVIVQ